MLLQIYRENIQLLHEMVCDDFWNFIFSPWRYDLAPHIMKEKTSSQVKVGFTRAPMLDSSTEKEGYKNSNKKRKWFRISAFGFGNLAGGAKDSAQLMTWQRIFRVGSGPNMKQVLIPKKADKSIFSTWSGSTSHQKVRACKTKSRGISAGVIAKFKNLFLLLALQWRASNDNLSILYLDRTKYLLLRELAFFSSIGILFCPVHSQWENIAQHASRMFGMSSLWEKSGQSIVQLASRWFL